MATKTKNPSPKNSKLPASEAATLGWLPEVGEWYSLTDNSHLYVFDNHEMAMAYYRAPTKETKLILLGDQKWIFITKITLQKDKPALVDFLIKNEIPQKIYTMPFYPPADVSFQKIWMTFLQKESNDLS